MAFYFSNLILQTAKQNKLVGDLSDTSNGLDVSYNPTDFKEVEI